MGKSMSDAPNQEMHEQIDNESTYDDRRNMSMSEKEDAIRTGSVPHIKDTSEAVDVAKAGGWEVDALMTEMEAELVAKNVKKGIFDIEFKNPKHFTILLVIFASMGGLLSGLDQSLISGANLFLPDDLHLTTQQNSLVNSGMPLGAVGGALLLSPCNEYLGRKNSIIFSCILYTIGAALEAGSINYGMIIAARVILGFGVGLEGGTVPVSLILASVASATSYHCDCRCTLPRQSNAGFVVTWSPCISSTLHSVRFLAMLSPPCS